MGDWEEYDWVVYLTNKFLYFGLENDMLFGFMVGE